jgi:hypothetical protein
MCLNNNIIKQRLEKLVALSINTFFKMQLEDICVNVYYVWYCCMMFLFSLDYEDILAKIIVSRTRKKTQNRYGILFQFTF